MSNTQGSRTKKRPARRRVPGRHRARTSRGATYTLGLVAACAMVGLYGCGGSSDAEIGVQTAPPTSAPARTAPASTTPAATTPVATTATPASTGTPADGADADDTNPPQAAPSAIDDAYLQFSVCMRDNGYPDFEDFTADVFRGATDQQDGARIFNEEMLRRGVDLADPSSGPAMEACQAYLNQAAAAAPDVAGADDQAQQELILNFAKCMRTQGVDDWPDPDFAANPPTGYSLETIQGFDFRDPKLIAAGQHCDPAGEVLAIFGR